MSELLVAIRPRYGEVDRMGVVYHAHYLVYFDIGRTEYLRVHGMSYADVEAGGHRLVVVDAAVRYLGSAHYDEELSLAVRLSELRGASVTFDYELRGPGDRRLATGHTRLGCLDDQQRPARLPAELARRLAAGRRSASPASQDS